MNVRGLCNNHYTLSPWCSFGAANTEPEKMYLMYPHASNKIVTVSCHRRCLRDRKSRLKILLSRIRFSLVVSPAFFLYLKKSVAKLAKRVMGRGWVENIIAWVRSCGGRLKPILPRLSLTLPVRHHPLLSHCKLCIALWFANELTPNDYYQTVFLFYFSIPQS